MIRVKENPIKMRVSDAVMIKGEPGDPGASAYEIWLAQGNTGTADEFLESLKGEPGEKGDPGAKGDPGDDYVLTEDDKTEIAAAAKKRVWYGTSGTAASTTTKEVTTTTGDFELAEGNILYIKFSYNVVLTAGYVSLNVDGTGARMLRNTGNAAASYEWGAQDIIGVVFNGSEFERLDARKATTQYYGVVKLTDGVESTSTTTAATPAAAKKAYDLANTANTESVKLVLQELTDEQKAQVMANLGLSQEVWTFTLEDGTTVEKGVVLV